MANKDDNRTNSKVSKWTCQMQRKFIAVKMEESELDSIKNSSKKRRTASVNIRSSPSTTDGSPKPSPSIDETAGIWRENAVGPEAKELFEAVDHRYPTTFQGVQIRGKPIWLKMLKELHVVIKRFMGTSVDSMLEDHITSLQEDLSDFEGFGFDLSWAQKRLDMVKRLKFGNEPLKDELRVLQESLDPLKARVSWRWKLLMEAHDMWKKARLECDNAINARDKKEEEMAQEFGVDFDLVLKGNLGFGMLPGY